MAPATWQKWAKQVVIVVVAVLVVTSTGSAMLWRDRPVLDGVDWPAPPEQAENNASVTATWLGVTTLLFDDGETQILIDGFFSRPSIWDSLLGRAVVNDAATINYALHEFRMRRVKGDREDDRPQRQVDERGHYLQAVVRDDQQYADAQNGTDRILDELFVGLESRSRHDVPCVIVVVGTVIEDSPLRGCCPRPPCLTTALWDWQALLRQGRDELEEYEHASERGFFQAGSNSA